MNANTIEEVTISITAPEDRVDGVLEEVLAEVNVDAEDILSKEVETLPDNMAMVTAAFFIDNSKMDLLEAALLDAVAVPTYH